MERKKLKGEGMKLRKPDRRSEEESRLDKLLEQKLEEAESLEDITKISVLMERRRALGDKKRISPDTMLIVGGNLVGIMMILGYEKANVLTSKALGMILRGRV